MKREKFLMLGTDSEFFVAKNENISSAIGLIGGSKEQPRLVERGNLQEDNVLAEFAINPVDSAEDWLQSIDAVVNDLSIVMAEHGLNLIAKSSHHFEKELLKSFGEKAMEMGCMPDFNAYTFTQNQRPNGRTTLRTAAGHIHFSYDNPSDKVSCQIIKCMDYALGLWSLLHDDDRERRELYGKAGCCRLKPYGAEYRAIGNFWLTDERMKLYVFNVSKACVENWSSMLPRFTEVVSQLEIQAIINSYNVGAASTIYPQIQNILKEYVDEFSE